VPSLLLLPCRRADLLETPQRPQTLHKPSTSSRKRKRGQEEQEAGYRSSQTREQPPSKRPRISPSSCTVEEKVHQGPASDTNENGPDPLQYWIQTGRWRKEYFEQDSQVREDFERGKSPEEFEQKDWLQEHYASILLLIRCSNATQCKMRDHRYDWGHSATGGIGLPRSLSTGLACTGLGLGFVAP